MLTLQDDRCEIDPLTASVHKLAHCVYPKNAPLASAAIASALSGFGVALYKGVVMELKVLQLDREGLACGTILLDHVRKISVWCRVHHSTGSRLLQPRSAPSSWHMTSVYTGATACEANQCRDCARMIIGIAVGSKHVAGSGASAVPAPTIDG